MSVATAAGGVSSSASSATSKPKTIILDIYGNLVRHQLGSWAATSTLITLLSDLGLDSQSVRSAVSRMKRRGLLVNDRRDGRSGYSLSEEATRLINDGDRRIFQAMEPAAVRDGWVLVVFSVPESERAKRHLIRSRLEWLGFGNPAPGVWIAPRRLLADSEAVIQRLGLDTYVHVYEAHYRGFAELRRMVELAWDLEGLEMMYEAFVAEQRPVLERWSSAARRDDRQSFIDYLTAIHQWRKFPFLDPGLPVEVLPKRWAGRAAAELFAGLARLLEAPAVRYMKRVAAKGLSESNAAVSAS